MQLAALCRRVRCTVPLAAARDIIAGRLGLAASTVERHIRALMAEGHLAIVAHTGAAVAPSKAERELKLIQAAAHCKAKAERAPAPDDAADAADAADADAPVPTAQSP